MYFLILQKFLQHVYVTSGSGNTGFPFYLFSESGMFIAYNVRMVQDIP